MLLSNVHRIFTQYSDPVYSWINEAENKQLAYTLRVVRSPRQVAARSIPLKSEVPVSPKAGSGCEEMQSGETGTAS